MSAGSRKLLVIDDDTIVRQSVVAYLEDSGFDVLEAGQGGDGFELFLDYRPDLIITDLRMPGIDGLALLDKVHSVDPDTPVIVISGAGVMGDVVEALRLGAADYLIKPLVDMEMLVHAISKSIERKQLIEENTRYRNELESANRELKDHLRSLELDQQAGRMVQQRLLPPNPLNTQRNYTAEHKIIPSLYLSGDFIDLAFREDRYLAFYLTDVSGHGASSAFATIWLKHVAATLANPDTISSDWRSPEGHNVFLRTINTLLLDSKLSHHMTCFTGLIDMERHKLSYSVAGHLPMPILVSEAGATYLEGKGRPLGLFSDQEWPLYEVDLPADSSLIGFSDGILEVLPPEDLIEKEAYLLNLMNKQPKKLSEVLSVLELDQLQSAPDDIAVLNIQCHGR